MERRRQLWTSRAAGAIALLGAGVATAQEVEPQGAARGPAPGAPAVWPEGFEPEDIGELPEGLDEPRRPPPAPTPSWLAAVEIGYTTPAGLAAVTLGASPIDYVWFDLSTGGDGTGWRTALMLRVRPVFGWVGDVNLGLRLGAGASLSVPSLLVIPYFDLGLDLRPAGGLSFYAAPAVWFVASNPVNDCEPPPKGLLGFGTAWDLALAPLGGRLEKVACGVPLPGLRVGVGYAW